MYHVTAIATLAPSLAALVSALDVPRATPPPGWNTALLEPYDVYHARYLALSCDTQHGTKFFAQCCHPLLATVSLSDLPPQCNPANDEEDLTSTN